MKGKNLLASVALFGELYNSKKYAGLGSIIEEFVMAAVAQNKKLSYSSNQIKSLLENSFEFDIPESVIRDVLQKSSRCEKTRSGSYDFKISTSPENVNLEKEIEDKKGVQEGIFSMLKEYVSAKKGRSLTPEEERLLLDDFCKFQYFNGMDCKYSDYISAFVIENSLNSHFINCLNSIREGLILYQGIKYTGEIENLGVWRSKLTIFLNTEYLFNAAGYDGVLFAEIFNDFHKLVAEINEQGRRRGEGEIIKLRYFQETKDKMDEFFNVAENIIKGTRRLDPFKTAMKSIVDGCRAPSDVVEKKESFYHLIESKGIKLEKFDYEFDEYQEYNVSDMSVLNRLEKSSLKQKKSFDKNNCIQFFETFTKINFLRKSKNKRPFENIGYIFMTESGFGKYLGHNNLVKFEDHDTSFAKDIDFITARFWFKLKKGLSERETLPKSFDVIVKSKLVLASYSTNSLSRKFDQLRADVESGKLTEDEAVRINLSFREKPIKPESITNENVQDTLSFLNDDEFTDKILREDEKKNELIDKKSMEINRLNEEIKERDKKEAQRLRMEAEKEVEKEKKNFVEEELCRLKKKNNRCLWWFLGYLCIVLISVSAPIILYIFKDLAAWLLKFGFVQIILTVLYACCLIMDFVVYKYFIKENTMNTGWNWLVLLTRKTKRQLYEESERKRIEEAFLIINSQNKN